MNLHYHPEWRNIIPRHIRISDYDMNANKSAVSKFKTGYYAKINGVRVRFKNISQLSAEYGVYYELIRKHEDSGLPLITKNGDEIILIGKGSNEV